MLEYTLVYDAAKSEFPWGVISHVGIMLLFGLTFFAVSVLRRRRGDIRFMIVWVLFVTIVGGLGSANVVKQHWQSKNWAESNDFEVVEGTVSNFHPMPHYGHDSERFNVNNVKFEYSDYDLSKGGFNNTASHGGPIKEGLQVRISYRDGRILKLEIGE